MNWHEKYIVNVVKFISKKSSRTKVVGVRVAVGLDSSIAAI